VTFPSIDEIRKVHESLKPFVIETPVLDGRAFLDELPKGPSSLFIKLELFQRTGSFKIRGALNVMMNLSHDELKRGVTAFSGGNHAIAVAYAAKVMGTTAKVVMPKSANAARVDACKSYGAEVHLVETRAEAPVLAASFQQSEGRTLVPPFEHPKTVEGTASLGYEFFKQVPGLDLIFIPIGGGGLAAGMACAIKQISPKCQVIGVQPMGADAMYRSFQSGRPEYNEHVDTIADSLCPPQVGAYTFSACQQFVDEVVRVDETDIIGAMRLLFSKYRLLAEGAGAISLGAFTATESVTLAKRRVGVIVSGSNIDIGSYIAQIG
jgi:threonine dehydratase